MHKALATSMFLIGLTLTVGCASNLSPSFSPDDAMMIRNVEPADARVADTHPASDVLVTANMKAAVLVVGLSQMSRLVDSARGRHD